MYYYYLQGKGAHNSGTGIEMRKKVLPNVRVNIS